MPTGELCSQSDAAIDVQAHSDSFFEYLKNTDTLLDGYRRNADKRVKIAIIDSGVDTQHPHIIQLQAEAEGWRRLRTASFVSSVEEGQDYVGHGTHIVATVMRIAKWAEIYVATVVDAQGTVNVRSVAKALTHAVREWKVNIVSLSLGFDRRVQRIDAALREADQQNILVFAAVSNHGAAALRQVAWPASMTKVFGINSANFDGVTSSFNPPENDNDSFSRYKLLGEGIRSAWPLHLEEGEEKVLSGTSMATPIAAATASLFIEFMRQNRFDEEATADAELITTPDGMKEIFHLIGNAKSKGDYFKYVTPWHLLSSVGSDTVKVDRICALGRIHEVLQSLRMYSSEGQDSASDTSGEPPVFTSASKLAPYTNKFAPYDIPVSALHQIDDPSAPRKPSRLSHKLQDAEQARHEASRRTVTNAGNNQQQTEDTRRAVSQGHVPWSGDLTPPSSSQRVAVNQFNPFTGYTSYPPAFNPFRHVPAGDFMNYARTPPVNIPYRPYSTPVPQASLGRPPGSRRNTQETFPSSRPSSAHRRVRHSRDNVAYASSTPSVPTRMLTTKDLEVQEQRQLPQLTAESLLAKERLEQDSDTEDTSEEADEDESITIRVTGQARIMVGGTMIEGTDGELLQIRNRRPKSSTE
ncbi:subtilisin-like protein [Mollisia scopiformis]|uniref:Subtilisin-like protein n=1 Tax=Mollisia scopiformis TaxID=149040 RepID=A0A194XNA1_MOLSC|nr:subtilisin-like protein [Mollisia scopiformis]KUJ21222.1 subtilisin-like protein [Mollisia scopiformis]